MDAIDELRQSDLAASKAYDVETLISLWTDDVVVLPPGGPPTVGKHAAAADLRKSAEQSRELAVLEYDQIWEETQVAGDFAFQWGYIVGAMQPRAGGDVSRYRLKALRVLRRGIDGKWLVHRTMWNSAPPAA